MRILPMLATLLLASCAADKPAPPKAAETAPVQKEAPPVYKVKFETSKGGFVVEINQDNAPIGARRFYELCRDGFFDDARFFRVLRKFVAQFGINKDPEVTRLWNMKAPLIDDTPKLKNVRGTIAFATSGPNSRRTQVFINLADNPALDGQGFAPIGRIVEGLPVVDELYAKYGDIAQTGGGGPDTRLIEAQGNTYLVRLFGTLDYIRRTTVLDK